MAAAEPTIAESLTLFAPKIEAIGEFDGRNDINSVDRFLPDDGRCVLVLLCDRHGYERQKVANFENGLWRGCWPHSATPIMWQELPSWR